MGPFGTFTSTDFILKDLARSYHFETKLLEFRLKSQWEQFAGEAVAAHTRPDKIKFRKLYVIVENSVWLQQLVFLKSTLLEKIQAAAPQPFLTDIVFRIGELPDHPPTGNLLPQPSMPSLEPPSSAARNAAASAACVHDPELRALLIKVISKAYTYDRDSREESSGRGTFP